MNKELYKAWKFFHTHAGWSTPPGRAVCALQLARAEQWAKDNNVQYEWVWDDMPWDGDCPAPKEILGCVATNNEESVSLWGIGDPDSNYRRVVEAELAVELQADFFSVLAKHIRQL